MEIQLPYGQTSLTVSIPDHFDVDMIEAPEIPGAEDPFKVVDNALNNLLGETRWEKFAGADSVAIAINDKTRPVPHQNLLPPLLDRLSSLGIPDEAVVFYVAVGTHPPMMPEEFSTILPPEILRRFKVISHDSEAPEQLEFLGETFHGTPVWVNRSYAKSDLKIVIGNIEPHQFVGFSGGVKSAAIGLAGLETINYNHALMTHPDSLLGEYFLNPARQDVEEMGQKIGVHLALNAILNHNRQIVYALAGDPVEVMKVGVPLSRQVCQVGVSQKYPIMIVSPGGHPKDINVYQSQKGLAHATRITQDGGTIILTAACPEGSGSDHYEEWARHKKSYSEILEVFSTEGFRIGPHKAFQIARDGSNFHLIFYTSMDRKLADQLLLNPVDDLQMTVDAALAGLRPGERIGVLPHAASTIPYYQN